MKVELKKEDWLRHVEGFIEADCFARGSCSWTDDASTVEPVGKKVVLIKEG